MNHTLAIAVLTLIITTLSSVIAGIPVSSNATIQSYVAFSDAFVPSVIADRGTVFNVTTTSDEINGDTTSVTALLANPGFDGVSLREAITATNNAPGVYTIRFAPALANRTVIITSQLPELKGGNVIINGNITGDEEPDIFIEASNEAERTWCFVIGSSYNTVCSVGIRNFILGVFFEVTSINEHYENNTVCKNLMLNMESGIGLHSGFDVVDTNCTWTNTRIYENRMQVNGSAISFNLHFSAGNCLEDTFIVNNTAWGFLQPVYGQAIAVSAGYWCTSQYNQITNCVIANNTLRGSPIYGIAIEAGFVGSSNNLIKDIQIANNTLDLTRVDAPDGFGSGDSPQVGIDICTADAGTDDRDPLYRPITFPNNNTIFNVNITGNIISGITNEGIRLFTCTCYRNNTIQNVRIKNNTITDIGLPSPYSNNAAGIKLFGCAGNTTNAENPIEKTNEISDIEISGNYIHENRYFFSEIGGGILITGGESRAYNGVTRNITISYNKVISDYNYALNIIGGKDETVNCTVTEVYVSYNTFISGVETFKTISYLKDVPNLRGAVIQGGLFNSNNNSVSKIQFSYNLVDGVQNGVSILSNPLSDNSSNNPIADITFAYSFPVQSNQALSSVNVMTNSSMQNLVFNESARVLSVPINDPNTLSRWLNLIIPKAMSFNPVYAFADGVAVPIQLMQNSTHYSVYITSLVGTKNIQFSENPLATPTPTPNPTNAPTNNPTTSPTTNHTTTPTTNPTAQPTTNPTIAPTQTPTNTPAPSPTIPELTTAAMITMLLVILLIAGVTRLKKKILPQQANNILSD